MKDWSLRRLRGGDVPKPRLLLRIVSTPSLTPEWELRTRTRLDVVRFSDEPRDQCLVTWLMLARGLSWWHGGTVRDLLRANAVIPDSAALAGVERLAKHEMNRELTSGVRLEVTLTGSRGMAVCATREHLVVRAPAEGQARLAVDRVLARAKTQ